MLQQHQEWWVDKAASTHHTPVTKPNDDSPHGFIGDVKSILTYIHTNNVVSRMLRPIIVDVNENERGERLWKV